MHEEWEDMGWMCLARLKVCWTKERMGIGENELEELYWGKTSNLCIAWKADDKWWWWWSVGGLGIVSIKSPPTTSLYLSVVLLYLLPFGQNSNVKIIPPPNSTSILGLGWTISWRRRRTSTIALSENAFAFRLKSDKLQAVRFYGKGRELLQIHPLFVHPVVEIWDAKLAECIECTELIACHWNSDTVKANLVLAYNNFPTTGILN